MYKFRSFDEKNYNLDSIENSYIYAPSPQQLNDPFELVCDMGFARVEKRLVERLLKTKLPELEDYEQQLLRAKNSRGIFSLVPEWNSELLWAHYADSHTGF